MQENDFTIGIEEEFFVVDDRTFDCVAMLPPAFMRDAKAALGDRVQREIIESMIEIVTGVHRLVANAAAELRELRTRLGDIAARHGLAILAAGTHPFADWRDQNRTPKARYDRVAESLQSLSSRIHVCGMHVHLGLADPETRIDLMNRIQSLLPVLLAASTSSPFWRSQPTGLKSYRLAAYDEIPRSGLPTRFGGWTEYSAFVDKLVGASFIRDSSYLWWAIRPSRRYPTLELRIADSCPLLADAVGIAAVYQCLGRHLLRHPQKLAGWENHHFLINDENRWRAMRFGVEGSFLTPDTGEVVPAREMILRVADMIEEDADALGCRREVAHFATIAMRGSGADLSLAVYDAALGRGADHVSAVRSVAAFGSARTIAVRDMV
jgi:glutamate---cysteine ligase / carboxylate-amine ligase